MLYRRRHRIENAFGRLKHWRRVLDTGIRTLTDGASDWLRRAAGQQVTTNYSFLRSASHVEKLLLQVKSLVSPPSTSPTTMRWPGLPALMPEPSRLASASSPAVVLTCKMVCRSWSTPMDQASCVRLCRLLTLGKGRAGRRGCSLT